MRGLEQRIREVEQTVSALLRDVGRLPVRHASPLSPRQGCWTGKASAAISKNSSGTVRIWSGEPGSEVDTGVDITNCYNRTADIESGAWVYVMFRHGYPYVEPAENPRSTLTLAYFTAVTAPSSGSFTAHYTGHFPTINDPPPLDGSGNFTVHDPQGNFPRVLPGAAGIAVYHDAADRWDVLRVQQQCLLAWAKINDQSGMNGPSVTISDFTPLTPAPFNLVPTPAPTSALNDQNHRGRNADYVILTWDESQAAWVVTDVSRHAATPLLNLRVSQDKTKLEGQFLSVVVETDAEIGPDIGWFPLVNLKQCSTGSPTQ